jgi:hypothetical protein
MWKFLDLLMILSALATFVYLFLSFKNKGNRRYVQLRELCTGLFFVFWGLGDMLNRGAYFFGSAFLGLGIVWLVIANRELRKKQ